MAAIREDEKENRLDSGEAHVKNRAGKDGPLLQTLAMVPNLSNFSDPLMELPFPQLSLPSSFTPRSGRFDFQKSNGTDFATITPEILNEVASMVSQAQHVETEDPLHVLPHALGNRDRIVWEESLRTLPVAFEEIDGKFQILNQSPSTRQLVPIVSGSSSISEIQEVFPSDIRGLIDQNCAMSYLSSGQVNTESQTSSQNQGETQPMELSESQQEEIFASLGLAKSDVEVCSAKTKSLQSRAVYQKKRISEKQNQKHRLDEGERMEKQIQDCLKKMSHLVERSWENSASCLKKVRKLRKLVAKLHHTGSLSRVQAGSKVFLEILQQISQNASGLSFSSNVPAEEQHSEELEGAVEASLTTFYFLVDKSMPVESVMDESISSTLLVFRKFLLDVFFTQLDPTANIGKKILKKAIASDYQSTCAEYFRLTSKLLQTRKLTDSQLLTIVNLSLRTLFVEGVLVLQYHAIDVICLVFARYVDFRTMILEDLSGMLPLMLTSRRLSRTYVLREEGKCISVISALLMRLAQCCMGLESFDMAKVSAVDREAVPIDNCDRAYSVGKLCAEKFQTLLLNSCCSVNSEVRAVFELLFEDYVECLSLPEWPSAELFINITVRKLLGMMYSKKSEKRQQDISLRHFAIQHVGRAAAKIRLETKMVERDCKFFLEERTPSEEDEDSSCVCNAGWCGRDMVQCDRCKCWYHFECVNVGGHVAEKIWCCDNCSLYGEVLKLNEAEEVGSILTQVDLEDDILKEQHFMFLAQQLLLQNLRAQHSGSESTVSEAIQYFLSQWNHDNRRFVEGDRESYPKLYALYSYGFKLSISQWKLATEGMVMSSALGRQDIMKLMRFIRRNRPLFQDGFETCLKHLIANLHNEQIAVRRDAMKALSAIVESDPDILGESTVKVAVDACLRDVAKAVRKQTMDLIGTFIAKCPHLLQFYIEAIIQRTKDVGISVRKASIGILHNICMTDPSNVFVTKICKALASRITDIPAIRKKVYDIFSSLWFKPLPDEISSGSSVLNLETRVEQIIQVIGASSNCSWLPTLLKQKISEPGKESLETRAMYTEICEMLVYLFITQEEQGEVSEGMTSGSYCLSCILALDIFSQVDPTFLVPHTPTLAGFISPKPQEFMGAEFPRILFHICIILERCVPKMPFPNPMFIQQLEKDLNTVIFASGSMQPFHGAIRCLCAVVHNVSRHFLAIGMIYQELATPVEKFVVSKGWKRPESLCNIEVTKDVCNVKLNRALYGLGLLCRYIDVDELGDEVKNRNEFACEMYKYLCSLHLSDVVLAIAAQGFSAMWIRNPAIALDNGSLVKSLLRHRSDRVQAEALKGLNEFFVDDIKKSEEAADFLCARGGVNEDEDMEDDDDVAQEESTPLAESGLLGSIIQMNKGDICKLLLHTEITIRSRALHCVQSVVSQGLIHPGECCPYIIALLADPDAAISTRARKLVIHLEKHYCEFFWNRVAEGLRLFVMMLSRLGKSKEKVFPKDSLLYPVYEVARGKRSTLHDKFFHHAIRTFDTSFGVTQKPDGLLWMVGQICALPFQSEDDVLHLIHLINHTISLQGNTALSDLHARLNSEKTSSSMSPEALGSLQKFANSAYASCLMLHLKLVLRSAHSIDSAKCKAYVPRGSIASGKLAEKADLARFEAGLSKYRDLAEILRKTPTDGDQFTILVATANEIHEKLSELLEQDEDDFEGYTVSGRRKSRRVASASSVATGVKGELKRARRQTIDGVSAVDDKDEEMDDEDESWEPEKKKRRRK